MARSKRSEQQTSAPAVPPALNARLIAAVVVGTLAYLLLPLVDLPALAATLALLRGAVAGAAVGLTCERACPPRLAAVLGATAGMVGALVLAMATAQFSATETLGIVMAAGVAFGCSWVAHAAGMRAAQAVALTAVLLSALVLSGFIGGPLAAAGAESRRASLSEQPIPEQYAFDGVIYLRTRDLMRQGSPYYQAFRQAIIEDSRLDENALPSPFNFREPFIFYVWKVLPGVLPYHLLVWFFLFGLAMMGCAYLLASTFTGPGPALLAPTALTPYLFFFWWSSTWFTMMEIWAAVFGVAALLALARGWRIPSLVLLVAAVATREFMIVLVPAWCVAWWFSSTAEERRASWWFPVLAVAVPVAVLGAHMALAPASGGAAGTAARWLDGSVPRLLEALRFAWVYAPVGTSLPLLFVGMATAGAALARPRWLQLSMLWAMLAPLLFLLLFSSGQWGYYWGAFYVPLMLGVMPAVFGRWVPALTGVETT